MRIQPAPCFNCMRRAGEGQLIIPVGASALKASQPDADEYQEKRYWG